LGLSYIYFTDERCCRPFNNREVSSTFEDIEICAYEKVVDAETKHREREADVTVVIEAVEQLNA